MVPSCGAAESGANYRRWYDEGITFELVDGPINDLIDDAYQAKYEGSSYLYSMISARARSATVKVLPRTIKTGTLGSETLR